MLAPAWQSGEILAPTEHVREVYRGAFGGCELLDASSLIQTARRRKTAYEAEKMRIASEISCIGLEAFQRMMDAGVSGVKLVRQATSIASLTSPVTGWASVTTNPPRLAPGSTNRLEEGMLTSVEPGIYFRPAGGFRIEDDVLVTASGHEVLGAFRKELT
jgi:Xaa-Pro aminopeptidase